MDNFDEKLCEEVQKYPQLYDSTMHDYRDGYIVQNTWREIALNLKIDVDAAKKKWKYLRECYVKSRKSATGQNGDGRSEKQKKYYRMLDWLSPFIKHRAKEASTYVESDSIQSDEQPNNAEEDFSPPGSVAFPVPSGFNSTRIPHEQRLARKRPRNLLEHSVLPTVQERDYEDEFTTFGKTVADTIRKLPRMSQICVKKNINDILFHAEMDAIKNASAEEAIHHTEFINN